MSVPAADMPARIRPLQEADRAPLQRIIEATGVFSQEEVGIALELIDAVLSRPDQQDYLINVFDDGAVAGYYCAGPTPATAGTFDLYWIAVDPARQGRGIGAALMRHAEELLCGRGGRLIIAETSARPLYEPTRRFYEREGYTELARIPGYYRAGDDLVVYGKYLS